MSQHLVRREGFLRMILIGGTAAYLLRLPYLGEFWGSLGGVALLAMGYAYLQSMVRVRVPPVLLVLLFVAAQVDLLGNYFAMYGRPFGPMQYDEFSHTTVSALSIPLFVWFLRTLAERYCSRLPLTIIAVMAVSLGLSASAIYEILELWDARYFGNRRIWGPFDTSNDLQWNFLGMVIGALLACALLGRTRSSSPGKESSSTSAHQQEQAENGSPKK